MSLLSLFRRTRMGVPQSTCTVELPSDAASRAGSVAILIGRIEDPSVGHLLAGPDRKPPWLHFGGSPSVTPRLPLVGSKQNADHAALIRHRLQGLADNRAWAGSSTCPAHGVARG